MSDGGIIPVTDRDDKQPPAQQDARKEAAHDAYTKIASRKPKFKEAQHETVRDIVMKEIAGNPRFKLAPSPGQGFVTSTLRGWV